MKKLSVILCLILCAAVLAGCAGTTVVYSNCTCSAESHAQTEPQPTAPSQSVSEGAVKTGLAVIANVTTTDASAEAQGKAEYDVTLAAVLVDDNGVILDCAIDSIGTSVSFGTDGTIETADGEVLTKHELGDDYGMMLYTGGAASGEWYQQANALASYAVGKTLEELKNGAVGETGYAQDADLATSATIYLGGYVSAIEKAVENAQHLGAQSGDTLKLVSINALSGGNLNSDVVALTLNGETITSCCIDALQATVTIGEDGTAAVGNTATKNELGEAYGMKNYAGATYEWNEQAANFAAYVTGKTAAEVAGIAVTEAGKPENADLSASVTIAIGGFQNLIAKAAG